MESGLVKVFLKTIWHNHGPYRHYHFLSQAKTRFQGTRLQGLADSVVYRDFAGHLEKSESYILKVGYDYPMNI